MKYNRCTIIFYCFLLFFVAGSRVFGQKISNIDSIKQHLSDVYAIIVSENRFASSIVDNSMDFPVGIKKTYDNTDYIICIDSIIITPKKAFASLFCIVENSKCNNERMFFYNPEVELNNSGSFSFNNEKVGRLPLLEDYAFLFGNNQVLFRSSRQKDKGSFVLFDCLGYRQMQLSAEITLLKDEAHLVDSYGNNSGPFTVSSIFSVTTLDEIYFSVTAPGAFQLDNFTGLTFEPESIIIDLSPLKSFEAMVFPDDYSNYDRNKSPLWEGMYIPSMKLTLPNTLCMKASSKGSPQAVSVRESMRFLVNGAAIDQMGLTCNTQIAGTPLSFVPSNMLLGRFDQWPVSIDEVSLSIVEGVFDHFSFSGIVQLPIAQEQNYFRYTGRYIPYTGYTIVLENKELAIFSEYGSKKIVLQPTSCIDAKVSDAVLRPHAILHGHIYSQQPEVNEFKGLHISSALESVLHADAVLRQEPAPPVILSFAAIPKKNTVLLSAGENKSVQYITVYKRLKGEKHWHKFAEVAKDTSEVIHITDTLVYSRFWYQYQFVATNENGLVSKPSHSISMQAKDKTKRRKIDAFYVLPNERKHVVHLTWEYPYDGVECFALYRADSKGFFTFLQNVDGSQRDYFDYRINQGEQYTYAIKAVFMDNTQSPFTLKNMSDY